MLTTCPECRTTFRLGHAQLEARRGLVRCGTCRAVFNAYDTLLPEFETPAAAEEIPEPETLTAETTAQEPVVEMPVVVAEPVPPPVDEIEEDTFETQLVGAIPDEAEAETEAIGDQDYVLHLSGEEVVSPLQSQPPSVMSFDGEESPESILLSELPTREQIEPEGRTGRKVLFVLLSLVLFATLVIQAVYFLRTPLLESMPELRPAMVAACGRLGCSVPVAADPTSIRVESSSLETDLEQPNRASLRVSISNRSSMVQQWPHIVLKLTDWKGSPLAQRVFKPAEYLSKDIKINAGMPPRQEKEFRLDLDLTGLGASGYEVLAKYP